MKALIVDDDIVSRMALVDLLTGYGIVDLVEAEDGLAAWRLLEQGLRPAICFCDVRMPRMTGIDLLQRMKADTALDGVPFVLVSSASDRDTVLQAVTLGAVGYVLKPLDAAEARAHLDKIFRITLDKLAEDPGDTMARLEIGAVRLHAYLTAFGEQLARARAAGHGPHDPVALHAGCVTLGLWQCAGLLAAAQDSTGKDSTIADLPSAAMGAAMGAALDATAEAIVCQLNRLHAHGAAGERGAPS